VHPSANYINNVHKYICATASRVKCLFVIHIRGWVLRYIIYYYIRFMQIVSFAFNSEFAKHNCNFSFFSLYSRCTLHGVNVTCMFNILLKVRTSKSSSWLLYYFSPLYKREHLFLWKKCIHTLWSATVKLYSFNMIWYTATPLYW